MMLLLPSVVRDYNLAAGSGVAPFLVTAALGDQVEAVPSQNPSNLLCT